MPSLKDLAKECGVSVATVSKALNDQPDIAPATRERIRAAARRMGYLPNAAARALKTNRTYNLGVLFVDEKQSGLTHEYFSAVLDSFKVEAEKRGYDITFINHNIIVIEKRRTIMEKRKPNDLPPEQCLAVDTDTLCKLLCCGRHTAVQIGDLANARITMNTRVLWSVQRIKEYLYDISG